MKFGAQRQFHTNGIAIYGFKHAKEGILEAITGLEFTQVDEGSAYQPFLFLTNTEAQELANELYAAGIHPTQAAGSAGQLEATCKHLEDMRTLVFKKESP